MHFCRKIERISTFVRCQVITHHKEGLSQRQIAKNVKISRNAVQQLIKKFEETGSVEDKKKCGRPKKLITMQIII